MKTLLWTAAILGASASALAAQQSTAWIANRGGTGSVTIATPAGVEITTLTAGYNFAQPWDIVYVPRYDRIVVSNNGNGTVTVINATTFAFVANVTLTGATNARGMSVSEDEEFVFIAAEHTGNPAAYQLRMSDLTETLAGEITDPTAFAEDVVVISANRVGGTGTGPGKVYFTIPNSSPAGYIYVLSLNPPGAPTSIQTAVGGLANVHTPTALERLPDHSAFFAACTTNDGGNLLRVIRVVPGVTDTFAQPIVKTAIQNLSNNITDIAFRPGGAPFRGYINSQVDASPYVINEIDGTGAALPVAARNTAVLASGRIRFNPTPAQLWIGETSGTSNQYGRADASTQPVGVVAITLTPAGQSGPSSFAFVPGALPPFIAEVNPRGLVSAFGTTVEIRGAHFNSSASVSFFDDTGVPFPRAIQTASSNLLVVDGNGLPPGQYEVRVTNPDTQNFRLVNYFLSIQPPPNVTPFIVDVPSRFQGYALRSVPQFCTTADLLAAINTQFGGYNPSNVRAFVQEGVGYLELNQAEPGRDLSGKSLWILSRFGGLLSLSSPPVGESLQDVAEDDFMVTLQTGWNMVTQPTVNPTTGGRMAMADVAAFSDPVLAVPLGSLDVAAANGDLSFPAEYLNNGYVFLTAADDLFAGRGYWIRNNTAGLVYLRFLTSDAQTKGVGRSAAPASGAAKAAGVPDLPPPPPGAALAEDGDTSGCGLPGLEVLAVLGFLLVRRGRKLAA